MARNRSAVSVFKTEFLTHLFPPVSPDRFRSFAAGNGEACSLSTLNPHGACGTIRLVGNNQSQAGRPSGSRAKVRHGMCGQRYARLNLDLHAMTEAPESQTHVVNVVGRVLWHGGQS